MNDKQEQEFLDRAKAELEQGLNEIDAQTLSRITQARHCALDQLSDNIPNTWWVPTGVTATVCLAFVVFALLPKPVDEPAFMLEDIELITTTDELDLYQDLEFYEWLETYELST